MHVKTITIESKKAKGDTNSPGLRSAIDHAKAVNMPADNIMRAVEKGKTGGDGSEEVLYEGYGPSGVAMIIEGITDNKNRTTPEIKHILNEHGGSLASVGAVTWAFTKKGEGWEATTYLSINPEDREKIIDLISDLEDHDDVKNIFTNIDLN